MTKELLNIEDVCKIFGISKPTENTWRKSGHLPKPLKMKGRIFYRRADISDLIIKKS